MIFVMSPLNMSISNSFNVGNLTKIESNFY